MLYIETTSRTVSLSDVSHLTGQDSTSANPFGDLTVGDVIDEATVVRKDNTLGVYFKLGDDIRARAQVCFRWPMCVK